MISVKYAQLVTRISNPHRPRPSLPAGMSKSSQLRSMVPRFVAAGVLALSMGGLTGCQKVLFTEREPRTQFEQYDRAHGDWVPPTLTDRNGRERPALRERLRPPHG